MAHNFYDCDLERTFRLQSYGELHTYRREAERSTLPFPAETDRPAEPQPLDRPAEPSK